MPVIIGKDLHTIAAGVEGRLQKFKMNRRHLRAQKSIIFAHLFRKDDPVKGSGGDGPFFLFLFL